ncbi:DUF397 domain-containing protein [Streptomyces sp. AP-93]|uniref:DUF397 domain-containing protein n=1 Tax=Streptomyces sp. AP-93 TaxID=2929048 RepID=UPI001FAF9AE4|nr:DUF397 domain-containing protein [Streptomyces sp. AP-93]MCJ0872136.1 DUF397 domain-containing protein [Streptomyces sp. AP-93]
MQTPAPQVTWHKSSYSGSGGDCVEVAETSNGGRAIRDSKDTTRPGLRCAAPAWAAFVHGLKDSAHN